MTAPGVLKEGRMPSSGPRRAVRLAILLAIALPAVALALLGCGGAAKGATEPAPLSVAVAAVVERDLAITREWIGTLDGSVNAEIRPQVEGYLTKQVYREGALVRRGDTLFVIDPRQFRAALDQAEADRSRAEAALGKAEHDVARFTPLAAEKAVSQQELDNARSAAQQAQADLDAARAAVERARLNLEWTRVVSPIDGIAGIARAQVGDLVGGQTSMTTVSTVDPIKVYFNVNESEYLAWAQHWVTEGASGPSSSGRSTANRGMFTLVMSDGSIYPHPGDPLLTDRSVDVKTGTIKVVALFPNPGNVLRPGQYGKVRATVEVRSGALLVPQRALSELQGSDQVVVIGADNKAEVRSVQAGERVGNLRAIDHGLLPGERVVVEGIQKVRPGMLVSPRLAVAED